MTRDEVKAKFRDEGITLVKWAKDRGYPLGAVYRVMAGVNKGYRGQAHEIAKDLGLKISE